MCGVTLSKRESARSESAADATHHQALAFIASDPALSTLVRLEHELDRIPESLPRFVELVFGFRGRAGGVCGFDLFGRQPEAAAPPRVPGDIGGGGGKVDHFGGVLGAQEAVPAQLCGTSRSFGETRARKKGRDLPVGDTVAPVHKHVTGVLVPTDVRHAGEPDVRRSSLVIRLEFAPEFPPLHLGEKSGVERLSDVSAAAIPVAVRADEDMGYGRTRAGLGRVWEDRGDGRKIGERLFHGGPVLDGDGRQLDQVRVDCCRVLSAKRRARVS